MSLRISSESTHAARGSRVETSPPQPPTIDLSGLTLPPETTSHTSTKRPQASPRSSAQEIDMRLGQSRLTPPSAPRPGQSTTWGTSVWNRAHDNQVVISNPNPRPRFPDSVWDRATDDQVVISNPNPRPRFPDSVWDRAID